MDVSDFLCHICLGILIEPVTMPCSHRICQVRTVVQPALTGQILNLLLFQKCLRRSIEINRTCCPLCKRRLGVWCRRNAKNMVDDKLWAEIRTRFPEQVQAKMLEDEDEEGQGGTGGGGDMEALEELFPCVPTHDHAQEGEVGKEFERQQREFKRQAEERRIEEERLSKELIKKLQQEDETEQRFESGGSRKNEGKEEQENQVPQVGSQKCGRGEKRRWSAEDDYDPGEGSSADSEEVLQQRRAMEEISRIREDEALAKRLQEEENRMKGEIGNKTPIMSKSKSLTGASGSKQKKRRTSDPSGSGKKLRQLSLNDFVIK